MDTKLGFDGIASYYDMMYVNDASYQKEVEAVVGLLQKYKSSPCNSLLDIACGTGAQAQYLSEYYKVTGIDLSPDMLKIAERKVPTARFVKADMCKFQLEDRFDAAVNLYGSIGFVDNYEQLCSSVKCVYEHLKSDGLFILTPWGTKEGFQELLVTKSKTVSHSGYCRMETVKRIAENKVQVEMHHLVASELNVSYHKNISTVSLFGEEQYVSSLKNAGFRIVKRLSEEEFRMGAFICLKG